MRYPKLVHLLMLCNIFAVLACFGSWQWIQQSKLQENIEQFGDHLSDHLNEEPAATPDLLSISGRVAPESIIGIQVLSAAGKLLSADGPVIELTIGSGQGWGVVDEYQTWQRELADGRKLVLITSIDSWPWWSLLGWLPLALLPVWLTVKIMHSNQQRMVEPLRRLLANVDETDPQNVAARSAESIEKLQKSAEESKAEIEHLRIAASKLEALHQQSDVDHGKQRQSLEQTIRQLQQHQDNWHLLSVVADELSVDELKHWLLVLATLQQNLAPARQQVEVHQAFAQLIRKMQPMWPSGVMILPDEDPQSVGYRADMDFSTLQLVLQSMMLFIRSLIEGREVVLGYRLQIQQMGQLSCSLQYNGKSLPEQVRSVLVDGEFESNDQLKWPDIRLLWCRQLMKRLGLQCKLTELTDLGARFELIIPVTWLRVNNSRRWQNLVVCEPRPCRRDLWQRSLLAVSEQVVVAEGLGQLMQATSSRLIDAVVVHLDDQTLDENELSLLENIANRFPLALFTPEILRATLPDTLQYCWQQSPLLLAGLQSLHQHKQPLLQDKQLLVVDDNSTNLSFIRAMLAGRGINIDIAMTGSEALQLAGGNRYQLILMDIQLPDISGVEVTRQLRLLRHHQKTNILAFTAHALPEEVASFRMAGMDDVMIKPLDARKIAHIISRLTPVTEMLSPG